MTPILTIIGFIVLYFVAYRLAQIKRDEPMGFRAPQKHWFDKFFNKEK
jgi:hypothetical protein